MKLTGPEHLAEAERLLAGAEPTGMMEARRVELAEAQVHAECARALATIEAATINDDSDVARGRLRRAWEER